MLGMPRCPEPHEHADDDCEELAYGNESINYNQGYMQSLCDAFETQFWPPRFADDEHDYGDEGEADDCMSLREAREAIKTLGTVKLSKPTCICTEEQSKVTSYEFVNFADEVWRICSGLCLGCVKEGRLDLQAKCHKVEHEDRW